VTKAAEPQQRPKSAGEFARRLGGAIGGGRGASRGRRLAGMVVCGACSVGAALAYVKVEFTRLFGRNPVGVFCPLVREPAFSRSMRGTRGSAESR
jgi:hypothetical protein